MKRILATVTILLFTTSLTLAADSAAKAQATLDKAQKFQQELGQWEDPNSYISLA